MLIIGKDPCIVSGHEDGELAINPGSIICRGVRIIWFSKSSICHIPMSAAERLRAAVANARSEKSCITVPGCHDAMSAVLIERAGFKIAFMSGFAVSATQLAMPDAGLISYGEMLTVGKNICDAAWS